MSAVQRISPNIRDIHVPAPLRDVPLWLTWAYEQHEGEAKPRKVPQYSMGGRRYGQQGSPSDLAKLTTFAVAREAAARRGLDGVGFALTPDAGIVALDFDHCVVDGKVDDAVLDLVQGTYAELSPSGAGVRAFFTGAADILGNRKSAATAERFGAEVFSSNGFVTVTGWMLDHIDLMGWEDRVAPLPARVIDYCRTRFAGEGPAPVDPDDFMLGHEPKIGLSLEEIADKVSQLDADMDRDGWIRVGMAIHHETDGAEEGFDVWNDWSEQGGKYPSEEALRAQWEGFDRRAGTRRRQVTMASVLKMVKEAQQAQGSAAIIERAEAMVADLEPALGVQTPAGYAGKFPISTALTATRRKPVDWLIKGVLPAADLILLYGASGSGKSFVALDMALAIAQGTPWRGHKTRRGKVVIVAAEGAGGYGNRILAACQHYGVDPAVLDIGLITVPPNLLEQEDVTELIAALKTINDIALIIIDTFAQVTPGANENAGEDMGLALSHCRTISTATDATVELVHHAGKDLARGSRGWSGIKAAVDAELEVSRDLDTNYRQIKLTKQKDGTDGLQWPFKLDTVVLGLDDDGDDITSCVVLEAEPAQQVEGDRKGVKRRGAIETHVIETMATFGKDDAVSLERLIRTAVDTMPAPDPDKRDTRRQTVMRAVQKISREPDGPLKLTGGSVIFYE
ncbi:MAG: hypothetical protein RLZZ387_2590 [Chloroflexota bacterium]|jgi:hypothetical protein